MSEEASLSFLIPLTKWKEKWFMISHSDILFFIAKKKAMDGKK